MSKLKMYQRGPNKNAALLKKISLMGTEDGGIQKFCNFCVARHVECFIIRNSWLISVKFASNFYYKKLNT